MNDRLRDWLDQHAPRLVAAYDWFWLRLTGSRCYAQGCGRLTLLHTPRQLNRCYDTPLALVLTEQGLARAVVAEAEEITQAAT
jgi:hypothetical protein